MNSTYVMLGTMQIVENVYTTDKLCNVPQSVCPYGVVVARLTCTYLCGNEKVPSSILGGGNFIL